MCNFRKCLVFLGVVASLNWESSRAQAPLNFIKCDDTSWILNDVNQAPPLQIIGAIITPLDDSQFPNFFNDLKEAILSDIQTGTLPTDQMIGNLQNLTHLNHYDLMISTLLAIKVYTPASCPIKEAIDTAVIYLLTRKYFNDDYLPAEAFDFSQRNCQKPQNDQEFVPSSSPRSYGDRNSVLSDLLRNPKLGLDQNSINDLSTNDACGCQSKLLALLLGKIIDVLPERNIDDGLQTNAPSEDFDIMQWLDVPQNPEKLRLFQLISDYFKSPEGQDLFDFLNLKRLMKIYSPRQILEIVFNALIQRSTNRDVVDAVKRLYYYKESPPVRNSAVSIEAPTTMTTTTPTTTSTTITTTTTTESTTAPIMDLSKLVPLISYPLTEDEENHYKTLKDVLENPDHSGLFRNFNGTVDDLEQSYRNVLEHLIKTPEVPEAVLAAARHYADLGKTPKTYNYADLMKLLPKPTTADQIQKYEQLRKLLSSDEIVDLLKEIDPKDYPNENDLFEVILETIIRKTTITNIKDIVRYIIKFQLEKKLNDKYINLLKLLPPAASDEDTRQYQILEEYFKGDEINEIFRSFNSTSTEDSETLNELLKLIATNAQNADAQKSAEYFLKRIDYLKFRSLMERLLKLLPTPNAEEKSKYEIMTNFVLQSPEAYEMLKSFDFSLFDDDKFLLETILKKIAENAQVPQDVIDACKYYVAAVEKLVSLEFVTKKEISKSFKLTELFTDTIELDKLNMDQRVAFKRLFKFISKIQPGSLEGFDSWDQAKTRGHFMKLFFQYLLKSESIPEPIKQSISTLEPLIRLDGKGALPP